MGVGLAVVCRQLEVARLEEWHWLGSELTKEGQIQIYCPRETRRDGVHGQRHLWEEVGSWEPVIGTLLGRQELCPLLISRHFIS